MNVREPKRACALEQAWARVPSVRRSALELLLSSDISLLPDFISRARLFNDGIGRAF